MPWASLENVYLSINSLSSLSSNIHPSNCSFPQRTLTHTFVSYKYLFPAKDWKVIKVFWSHPSPGFYWLCGLSSSFHEYVVYTCVCRWECKRMPIYMCESACGVLRLILRVFLELFHLLLWGRVSRLNLVLANETSFPSHLVLGMLCFHLWVWRLELQVSHHGHPTSIYVDSGDLNSGPFAHAANILTMEPSPQL